MLSAEELQHTARVAERVAQEIAAAGGWISFERYMDIALYAPGLGYYSAGAHKLGRGGDFTTAPEISRLFGACVAQQCADILRDLGGGSILEIGAGSGRLAADMLSRLETLGRLPARYLILEVSADLRERQRRTLRQSIPHLEERIEWLDAPPGAQFDGVIVANEVLDALPVSRFRWYGTGCEELGVALEQGEFAWAPRPANPAMAASVPRARSGRRRMGRTATSPSTARGSRPGRRRSPARSATAWRYGSIMGCRGPNIISHSVATARSCATSGSAPTTIRCATRVLQDITAWVDFTALAEACTGAGCRARGLYDAGAFPRGLEAGPGDASARRRR